MPVTTPLEEPTVAMPGFELVQVPLPASESVVVPPGQTSVVPDIAPGAGFTVSVRVTEQPVTGSV
jgi:hypothetical protein